MEIKFCGAARTVTGSSHLLTLDDGYKILLDCGLYQGREEEFNDYNSKWFFDPAEIDCLILSHAHIDHCGRIPKLVKDGFKGKIYSTAATRDLCAVMLMDSAKIQENDAKYINKKRRKKKLPETAEPLYTSYDIVPAIEMFVGISYGIKYKIREDIVLEFRDSGHIFGSASITLDLKDKDGNNKRIGFSGDIGRPNRPIIRNPMPMDDLDYLICESTYGGRRHNSLPKDIEGLLKTIQHTCIENKGKLIIPAFSVGRTQEIVYTLDRLETEGKLPHIPVYVDSPLSVNATEIFQLHPDCFDADILEYMLMDPNPFGFNNLKYVRSVEESKRLNRSDEACIIISASGMMTGGRIMHHIFHNIDNSKNTIFIVGYCAPHTLGARVRRGDKKIKIFGETKKVKASVEVVDSYSAHGDQDEMLEYLDNLDRTRLKNIFLVHGELDRQEIFREALLKSGFADVQIPGLNDVGTLK
ncbi:MAG TPA: MBL fold metallo-hydrolase [Thermodesulfobacteriota bacterium]|nr:MBL fold metallo-hydrolase [Thermodesulfobacteriota bacterium]